VLLQQEVPHREVPIDELARWVAHGDPALTPTSADLRARQIELARMMLCDDYTREVFAQHYVMEHPALRTGGAAMRRVALAFSLAIALLLQRSVVSAQPSPIREHPYAQSAEWITVATPFVLPSTSVEVGVHRLADGHRERGDSLLCA
jgi:hypothetical protein